MPTLLLCLAGPMQSWGTRSRFEERDTGLEPSKSAVLGLLCAALGRDRSQTIDDLTPLRMGVRVDREGILKRDYHTAQEVIQADGRLNSSPSMRNVISERYYLADAVFLVGLEPPSPTPLLDELHQALKNPHWPLFLGRKAFVPSQSVFLADGLDELSLEQSLKSYPLLVQAGEEQAPKKYRFILETPKGSHLRYDQPASSFAERHFLPRRVEITSESLASHSPHRHGDEPEVLNALPRPTQTRSQTSS
ncbi:MAG: type I-E CRISPR-associated protein Cas5/CasD [Deinococcales bacterium]